MQVNVITQGLQGPPGVAGAAGTATPFDSVTAGVVPASGGGTTNFLRADGTWNAPPGGVSVTDGTKGDITVSGTGTVWTIPAATVTLSKMANLAASTILGNNTGAGATPIALTAAQVKTMLAITTADFSGVTTAAQEPAHTGDVTNTAGSLAMTIANNAVTNAKSAQMATLTIRGNNTGGTANVADLTVAQVNAMLPVVTSALNGLAPLSGGGTTNFLRADGTWVAPPGTGGVPDGDKGDVIVSGSGTVWTVDNLPLAVNTQTGTTYTFVLADATRIAVVGNNAATKTFTLPLNASLVYPVGSQIVVRNEGAGAMTVACTGAATLNGVAAGTFSLANGEEATLWNRGADVWQAILPGITTAAATALIAAINNNASYRLVAQASASHTAAVVAGTYALGAGDPAAVSGTGTLYPLNLISIAAADYPTINSLTTKLRIRAQVNVNDVAPTGNFTFGLYPIARPVTSGGAGLNVYTLGTVVSGSNGATVSAPAADSANNLVGSDFALPADGLYVIGVVTTATVAASSHLHLNAQLQMRNA